MSEEDIKIENTGTKEFTENPYDHQNARPEDVVRLFYIHDVPIIPVVSKRGVLIGILKKQGIISELSDIERVEKLKIDEFITRNAVRMTFDDLIPYGKIREFVVINIFGEVQGKWSRIQLFTACDTAKGTDQESEVKKQQEDQVLEWMIYLILEHIPRALYAINEKGRTIFYNSHFEDLYTAKFGSDVNVEMMEKLFSDPLRNELFSSADENDLTFHNDELDIFYEKIRDISLIFETAVRRKVEPLYCILSLSDAQFQLLQKKPELVSIAYFDDSVFQLPVLNFEDIGASLNEYPLFRNSKEDVKNDLIEDIAHSGNILLQLKNAIRKISVGIMHVREVVHKPLQKRKRHLKLT